MRTKRIAKTAAAVGAFIVMGLLAGPACNFDQPQDNKYTATAKLVATAPKSPPPDAETLEEFAALAKADLLASSVADEVVRRYDLFRSDIRNPTQDQRMEMLTEQLTLEPDGQGGLLLRVRYSDGDVAAKVANELARALSSKELGSWHSKVHMRLAELLKEEASLRDQMDKVRAEAQAFRKQHDMDSMPSREESLAEMADLNRKAVRLEDDLRKDSARLIRLESKLERARATMYKAEAMAPVEKEAGLQFDKLTAMEAELERLRVLYTDDHYDVVMLKQKIAKLKKMREEQGQVEPKVVEAPKLESAYVRVDTLEEDVATTKARIAANKEELESTQLRVRQLRRYMSSLPELQKNLDAINSRYKELEASHAVVAKQVEQTRKEAKALQDTLWRVEIVAEAQAAPAG